LARSKKQPNLTTSTRGQKSLGALLEGRADYNPRRISDHDAAQLDSSLREFGLVEPVVWNQRTSRVVGGHQRLASLERLGVAPDTPVDVVLVDLDEQREKVLNLKLNRVRGDWDWPRLEAMLDELASQGADLPAAAGFTAEELAAIERDSDLLGLRLLEARAAVRERDRLDRRELDDPGPGATGAAAVSKFGDHWFLGGHCLLCGDATDPSDVEVLLRGEPIAMMMTDPPCCVDYTGDNRPGGGKDWSEAYDEGSFGQLEDLLRSFLKATLPALLPNAPIYIWHAQLKFSIVDRVLEEFDVLRHQPIIWVKPGSAFGYSFYRWAHETCIFGWKKGHRPPRHLENGVTSVWEVDWDGKGRPPGDLHPTSKPPRLFEIPMELHTRPGDLVFEPFCGSGSQIIAAERLGRRCRGLEIQPLFVDAAIRRWQRMTGRAATHAATGKTFEETEAERAKP
jgi:DNA modification methylase